MDVSVFGFELKKRRHCQNDVVLLPGISDIYVLSVVSEALCTCYKSLHYYMLNCVAYWLAKDLRATKDQYALILQTYLFSNL